MTWASETIQLPFNVSSFLKVLEEGTKGSLSHYAHAHIIDWTDRFGRHLSGYMTTNTQLAEIQKVADDLVVQWELYIAATYTIEQMQQFDQAHLLLPSYHFEAGLAAVSTILEQI